VALLPLNDSDELALEEKRERLRLLRFERRAAQWGLIVQLGVIADLTILATALVVIGLHERDYGLVWTGMATLVGISRQPSDRRLPS
jgi:hypothetical protein